MRSKWCLLLALCLSLTARSENFRWDNRVQHGQLENGFSYYIVSGKEMKQQVSMQLLVRVGSLDERDGESGVAHMVEHMVFHATSSHPEGLRGYLEGQNWRIGKHYNAQTNFERTLYQLALDARPQRVEMGLEVLAEIAGGARIPAEGLERERAIILEEWRTKLGVRERMEKQRRAMLREGSLYPERPTIGTEASIRSQPAATLQRFYSDWYRPGNMALIVVGNVDAAALRERIRARFGGLQAAPLPARNPADPRLRDQLRVMRLQDAESGASQVGWVTRFVSAQGQDDAGLRERIIDRIAERSLRALVRRVAQQLPDGVESLTSSKGEVGARTASLGFAASVTVDGHAAGLRQLLLLRERVLRDGLRPEDIRSELAEVQRLNDKGPQQQAARDFSGWLQMLGEAVQQERVLQDPLQKQAQIRLALSSISEADVNARVRGWLTSPDRVVFMMAPGLSPLDLPTASAILGAQQQLASAPLPPQPASAPTAATAEAMPAPAASMTPNGDATRIAQPVAAQPALPASGDIVGDDDLGAGARRWTLANGDTLIWLHAPGDTAIRFSAQSGAGYRQAGAPAWQWQLAAQLGNDADLPGLEAGKPRLSQQQSETQLRYEAQVAPAQLANLLHLYAARQTQSEPATPALSASTRQLARQAARRPDSINERAAAEMSRLRYGDLPLDGAPKSADLQALNSDTGLQTLRQQWRQLTHQPVTYFISGPADQDTVRELARRYLAGIPRTRATTGATPPTSELTQRDGYHASRLEIGIEPQGSVRAFGSQAMTWSPERAMRTAILSRIVYRQLRHELREKEAGIYRLNYKLSLEPEHNRLASELSFTAAPERLDALWEAARRVLERLPSQLDDAMLKEEIQQMRNDEARRVSDDSTRFNRLQLSYKQFGNASYLDDSKQLTASLTPADVRALASEFQLTRDLAVVKVLPKPDYGK